MKVFISWSGDLSERLGEVIRNWLPAALQFVRPYFTPRDIDKGTRWATEIATELQASSIGIFCLTRDNLAEPWLLFEAGAISRVVSEAHVCPLLFGVAAGDVSGPLSQFQMTQFNRNEFFKLFCTINRLAGDDALSDATRDEVFEMWWPRLDSAVQELLSNHKPKSTAELRADRDLIEETLMLARSIAKEMPTYRDLLLLMQVQAQLGGKNPDRPNWSRGSQHGLTALGSTLGMSPEQLLSPAMRDLLQSMRDRQQVENRDSKGEDPGRESSES